MKREKKKRRRVTKECLKEVKKDWRRIKRYQNRRRIEKSFSERED